jgi:NOL1/NOP2/fmu family ribosome biogenesis protein
MSFIKILSKNEKREIERKLNKQFGIKEISGMLIKFGKDRIFFFSGKLKEKEIRIIESEIPIERIGVYFARIMNDFPKLSIEGTQILKEQISKNIFELDEKQLKDWMSGRDLNISSPQKGFLVMKYKEEVLGCGKASENKISNFIPKMRRLKNREI